MKGDRKPPRGISSRLLQPQSLTSYHPRQEGFPISWLPLLSLEPRPPPPANPTSFSSTKCQAACVGETSSPFLASRPPVLPATRPPARPRWQAAPFPPRPRRPPARPPARRPGTRGTNSARSCTRQTPVPLGLREIWREKHRQQWAHSREVYEISHGPCCV